MNFQERDDGVSFSILLTPRASKTEIYGLQGGSIRIKVSSPPIENKANLECIELLAKVFNTAKSGVSILKGHRSRRKEVHIQGLTCQRAEEILNEHIV